MPVAPKQHVCVSLYVKDALPPKEMNPAEKHCKQADIVLCLGTGISSDFCSNLMNRGLIMFRKKLGCLNNPVIAGVMEQLNLQIPPFVRIDLFQIIMTHALSNDKKYVNWTLQVASAHGQKATLPFIKSIEVSFLDKEDYKAAVLDRQPFRLKRLKFNHLVTYFISFGEIDREELIMGGYL
ncbi:hypothetical protein RIF29_24475 [Crotalaria pallida]|uniref:Deacetylase sirtuin-type domain-containing protein n=1 Tax=Crotalaria pallida TaxID=3830 RepID=A0AAN9EMA6_CROPI